MTDPEKIDWAPLDPSRDEARWSRLVAETARRGRERAARRAPTIFGQLVAWRRPAFACAAALAVATWSGSEWVQRRAAEQARAAAQGQQAVLLLKWAQKDEVPPPEVLLQVIGGPHGDR